LKFSRIAIQNFGILADVAFAPESKSVPRVVFLNARNGRGKTSFQGAIRWCIFGSQSETGTSLSRWAIKNANPGDTIEMVVELDVSLGQDGARASIKRSQLFEVLKDKRPRRVGQEAVVVREITPGGLADVHPNPEAWLQKFFPQRLSNFFLFDGELMKNFFDTRVKGAIEDAVREIAGVDYFEDVRHKLEAVKTQIDKSIAKKSGGDAEKLRQKLHDARLLALKISEKIVKDKATLSGLEEELKEKEGIWKKFEDLAADANRSIEIQTEIVKKQLEIDEEEELFRRLILAAGPKAMISGGLEALRGAVESAQNAGTLPPPFNPQALQHLVERGTCICGADLSEGEGGHREISGLISGFEKASTVGKRLDDTARQWEILKAQVREQYRRITDTNKRFISLKDEKAKLAKELEALAERLIGHQNQSAADLGKRVKELHRQINDLRLEVAADEKSLNQELEPSAISAQNAFDEASKGQHELDGLRREASLAGELAQAAGAIHRVAIQLVRERLEESVSTKFKVVKSGSFVTRVTEDFEVITENADGTEAELSEGEKMMKAYIFSIALREVVGLSFPLIVDTPFGRLDEYYREQLAEMLAQLVSEDSAKSNRQVIFLMHDGEYTPYTKKHFDKVGPYESYLAWEVDEEKSNIGVGIDPDWFSVTAWKDWKEGKIK